MGWKADRFSDMGYVLSGRDALEAYGVTSSDNNMTFIESENMEGLTNGLCCVPRTDEYVVVKGRRYAPYYKAMIDYMKYPYDDSGILESLEFMDEEELCNICSYAKKTGNLNLLNDNRWSSFFEGVI